MRGDGGVFKPKDRNSWWCFVPRKHLPRLKRGPFRTKSEALEAWRALRKEVAAGRFAYAEEATLTVEDLLTAYRESLVLRGKKSLETFDPQRKIISAALGPLKAVEVTAATLEHARTAWLAEDRAPRKDGTVSGKRRDLSTVDHYFEILRSAYILAAKKKRISVDRVPYFELAHVDNVRQGFVEEEDFWKLYRALSGVNGAPSVHADVCLFAYRSGWRRGEVEGLTFDRIDTKNGEAWLYTSKNGRGRVLPLEAELAEVIARREAARRFETPDGPSLSTFVFHENGRPLGDWRKRWARACTAAGKPGLHFHDFRRSAITNMTRAGVPAIVAMGITGHKTRAVFDRYNIPTTKDSRAALRATVHFLTGKDEQAEQEKEAR